MRRAVELHRFAAGKDFVTAILFVPLRQRRRHVHLLDDIAPADARVVSAEANLAFLRRVRNNTLLGAAEIIIEQVLKPHASDEQEVPAVAAALLNILRRTVATDLAVIFAAR